MAENITVARPYARAAFEIARERDSLEDWSSFLAAAALVVENPDFHDLHRSPHVASARLADLVIENCTIVTPEGRQDGGVAVRDGKIAAVGTPADLPSAETVVDAGGNYLVPGIIDSHIHNREPGLEYKEDWETATRAAAAGGVTAVHGHHHHRDLRRSRRRRGRRSGSRRRSTAAARRGGRWSGRRISDHRDPQQYRTGAL